MMCAYRGELRPCREGTSIVPVTFFVCKYITRVAYCMHYTSSTCKPQLVEWGLVECMYNLPVLRPTLCTHVPFALHTTGLVRFCRHCTIICGRELRMRATLSFHLSGVQPLPSSLAHAEHVLSSFVISCSVVMVNAAVIVVVVAAAGAFISLALHKIEEGRPTCTPLFQPRVWIRISFILLLSVYNCMYYSCVQ